MIRQRNKKLKIGWIVPTIGIFGAVREMVEVSNVLVGRGHSVFIYHPDGTPCKWLTCLASSRKLASLQKDRLDVLIGIVDWQTELYRDLLNANAKYKAICLLGFSPNNQMAQALRGEVAPEDEAQRIIYDAMRRKFGLLTDSSWQIKWIEKQTGYPTGPSFGGVNTQMFFPVSRIETGTVKIIYSGDPRDRKGTDTVEAAIDILKQDSGLPIATDFYWGKRFSQAELVDFIQQSDIFLDGHRRAGWCNPVAEAMACGSVPVCTHIGANSDFALHEKTALVVPVDDSQAMADAAMRLIENKNLRNSLREEGIQHIRNFSYENVAPILEKFLEKKVNAQ